MNEARKKIGIVVLLIIVVVLVISLIRFVHHRMRYAVTNAVFVETDRLVYLGFEDVGGRIKKVLKEEGEPVEAGETIAKLDNQTYQTEVARLKFNLSALKKEENAKKIFIERLKKDISLNISIAKQEIVRLEKERDSLIQEIKAIEADINQLRRDKARFQRLWEKGLIPKRKLEEIETNLDRISKKKAALIAKQKALEVAIEQSKKRLLLAKNQRKQIAEAEEALASLKKRVKALEASLIHTKLLLDHCLLKSPINGIIAKRFHVDGDVVGPGEPVFALVDPHDLYILVLLEETKLHGVKPGCIAKIKIDAYPKEHFEGVVEEILPTTAAKFALVPRDISAGEFTKLAQRVPIKIIITKGPVQLLRVGLGGEVEIRRYE